MLQSQSKGTMGWKDSKSCEWGDMIPLSDSPDGHGLDPYLVHAIQQQPRDEKLHAKLARQQQIHNQDGQDDDDDDGDGDGDAGLQERKRGRGRKREKERVTLLNAAQ